MAIFNSYVGLPEGKDWKVGERGTWLEAVKAKGEAVVAKSLLGSVSVPKYPLAPVPDRFPPVNPLPTGLAPAVVSSPLEVRVSLDYHNTLNCESAGCNTYDGIRTSAANATASFLQRGPRKQRQNSRSNAVTWRNKMVVTWALHCPGTAAVQSRSQRFSPDYPDQDREHSFFQKICSMLFAHSCLMDIQIIVCSRSLQKCLTMLWRCWLPRWFQSWVSHMPRIFLLALKSPTSPYSSVSY